MNPIITILPYLAIVIANALYFYSSGLDPVNDWYMIFLFNFCLMLFIGIFIIINLNILLYKWVNDDRITD